MANDSLVTNFSSDSVTYSPTSISIELDGDYHITLYGEDKSEFAKTEIVYLKVSPPYSETEYEILTSKGTCNISARNNRETVIDLLAFENETSASLSNLPYGAVSTEWIAGSGSSVLIDEAAITTTDKVIGILKCTYEKEFDRLQLTVSQDMSDDQVIVMVGSEINGYDSITVDYSITIDYSGEAGTDSILRSVTLIIKDIVSDAIISGASVIVTLSGTEIFNGTSNENGKVTIQNMIIGSTYDLMVTATNYLNSDADYLNNDSFTVPEL